MSDNELFLGGIGPWEPDTSAPPKSDEEILRDALRRFGGPDWVLHAYSYFGFKDFHPLTASDSGRVKQRVEELRDLALRHWGASHSRARELAALTEALTRLGTKLGNKAGRRELDELLEGALLSFIPHEVANHCVVLAGGRKVFPLEEWSELKAHLASRAPVGETASVFMDKARIKLQESLANEGASLPSVEESFKSALNELPASRLVDLPDRRAALQNLLVRLAAAAGETCPDLGAMIQKSGHALLDPVSAFSVQVLSPLAQSERWMSGGEISQLDLGRLVVPAKDDYGLDETDVRRLLAEAGISVREAASEPIAYTAWKDAVVGGKPEPLLDSLLDSLRSADPGHKAVATFDSLVAARRESASTTARNRRMSLLAWGAGFFGAFIMGIGLWAAALIWMWPAPALWGILLFSVLIAILYFLKLPGLKPQGEVANNPHTATIKALEEGLNLSEIHFTELHPSLIIPGALFALIGCTVLVALSATAQLSWLSGNPPYPAPGEATVRIPAGSFIMGASKTDYPDQEPAHKITITHDLIVGRYEVSRSEWATFKPLKSPLPENEKDLPAVRVSWWDALAYCNARSKLDNLPPAYKIETRKSGPRLLEYEPDGGGWRLPTEAEWEYVARRGNTWKAERFAGGDDPSRIGVFAPIDGPRPRSELVENRLGIGGMSGNVWEWCYDSYAPYSSDNEFDPAVQIESELRILRGGSFLVMANLGENRYRYSADSSTVSKDIGFRIVRNAPTGTAQ